MNTKFIVSSLFMIFVFCPFAQSMHKDNPVYFEQADDQDQVCLDNFDAYDGDCKSLSWNGDLTRVISAFDRKTHTKLGKVTFKTWYPCKVARMWINGKAIDSGIRSEQETAKDLLEQAIEYARIHKCSELAAWMRKDETSLFTQVGGEITHTGHDLCQWKYQLPKQ